MATGFNNQANHSIELMINRILDTGQINRQEYFQLVTLFLNDLLVNDLERSQINCLFDELQLGRVQFLD